MAPSNRLSYKRHQWSGGTKKKKQIKAALQRYGKLSRAAAWRTNVTGGSQPGLSDVSVSNGTHHENQSLVEKTTPCLTDIEMRPKTYERAKPITHVEASCNNINTRAEKTKSHPVTINWPFPDPTVEAHQLQVEKVPNQTLSNVTGYRIVDIKHILQWAFSIERHKRDCSGSVIDLVNEIKVGSHSVFTFECSMCGKIWKQTNEKTKQINKAFVWGTVTAGSHYAAAAHTTSCMDIPTMSAMKFRSIEKELGNVWQDHLTEEIIKTGEEEKAIAIEKGHVNENGVPYVTVYVDGDWLKRSYGHNFNSSSGMV